MLLASGFVVVEGVRYAQFVLGEELHHDSYNAGRNTMVAMIFVACLLSIGFCSVFDWAQGRLFPEKESDAERAIRDREKVYREFETLQLQETKLRVKRLKKEMREERGYQ